MHRGAADAQVPDRQGPSGRWRGNSRNMSAVGTDALDGDQLAGRLLVPERVELEGSRASPVECSARVSAGKTTFACGSAKAARISLGGWAGRKDLVGRGCVATEVGEEPLVGRPAPVSLEGACGRRSSARARVVVVRAACRTASGTLAETLAVLDPGPSRHAAPGSASRRCAMAPSGMGFERGGAHSGSSGRPRAAGHAGVRRVLGLDLHVGADLVAPPAPRRSPPPRSRWRSA